MGIDEQFFNKLVILTSGFSSNYFKDDRFLKLFEQYNENDIYERYGVEYYVVNYFKYGNGNDGNRRKLANKLYDALLKDPYKYFDSFLFLDGNVNCIFSGWKLFNINRIKKHLSKEANRILNNGPKDDKERHFLMKYLKLNINLEDERQKKLIEQMIDSDKCIEDSEELNFLGSYLSKWMFKKEGIVNIDIPVFSAIFEDGNWDGYANKNFIFLNISSKSQILRTIQLIFHETEHIIQYNKYKELLGMDSLQDSIKGFDYFVNEVITLGNFYHKNYRFSRIELDSEKVGYDYTVKFLQSIGRDNLIDRVLKIRDDSFCCRGINYEYIIEPIISNSKIDYANEFYEYAMSSLLDELLTSEMLKEYPFLLKLYSEEGKPRPFEQLIVNDFSINEDLDFYFNHVFRYIQSGSLDNFNLDEVSDDEKQVIYNNLMLVFNRISKKIIGMIDDSYQTLLNRYSNEDPIEFDELKEIYDTELTYYFSFISKLSNYLYAHIDKLTPSLKNNFSNSFDLLFSKFSHFYCTSSATFLDSFFSNFSFINNAFRKDSVQKTYKKWFDELVPQQYRNIPVDFDGEKYELEKYVFDILPLYADINDISNLNIRGKVVDFDNYIITIISTYLKYSDNLSDISILLDLLKKNYSFKDNGREDIVSMYNKIVSDFEDSDYCQLLQNGAERINRYYQEHVFANTPVDFVLERLTDKESDVVIRSRNR